jgi:hypothetical protein
MRAERSIGGSKKRRAFIRTKTATSHLAAELCIAIAPTVGSFVPVIKRTALASIIVKDDCNPLPRALCAAFAAESKV